MGVVELRCHQSSDHFEAARQQFSKLIEGLEGTAKQAMKLTDLEKNLNKEGRELLRLLLQAHMDSRGNGDVGLSVEGYDGVDRTHKRIGHRQIKTLFGTVELDRIGYGQRNVESLFPKDGHLNLPETSHSFELQRRVVSEVIKSSYDNAVEAIIETTGTLIHKQQIEHITVSAAQDFDAFYDRNASKEKLSQITDSSLLILTTDGKGIVMQKEDLRPATRKKAEESTKKLEKRLSSGEKRNSKRMATVASVYNIEQFIREPDDFKKELASIRVVNTTPRPKPQAKRVWASVEKDPGKVIEEMFDEALRRDPEKKRTWVALVDGAIGPIEMIESKADALGVKVTIVCDIIHVIEYLWKAAWAFFKKGDPCAEAWVNDRFIAILEGKSSTVAAGIRRSATNRKMSQEARKSVDICATYLHNKGPYLKYNKYLEAGYPIATGVIEGACRHLIKDRMDLTGARWRLLGAEAVLKLRSLKASGDFKDYWQFHEEQEFSRNHSSKYKKPAVIKKLHIRGV